jgi:DNA-binding Lrp family transcriptional regulator
VPHHHLDDVDRRILGVLDEEPRLPVMELARRVGVARGTAQARLDRLLSNGVIAGFGPHVEPSAIGYPVLAFTTLETSQGDLAALAEHLAAIPEVLEAHTITGAGDLMARVVARSNTDLQRVIDLVLANPAIVRSSTVIALATQVPYRVLPLALDRVRPDG